jgi:hypothetical protein
MKNTDTLFFDILRNGLWGTSDPDRYCYRDENNWNEILDISLSQTVVGIVENGLNDCRAGVIPSNIAMQFISHSISTEKRNLQMNAVIAKLFSVYKAAGIPVVLVKGQAIAQYYRKPLSRQSGDIDLIVQSQDFENAKKCFQTMANDKGIEEDALKKHFATYLGNIEVELHGTIRTALGVQVNKVLDLAQMELFIEGGTRIWVCNNVAIRVPSADFDTFYTFAHMIQHFYGGGLGLRQLCDLTMALHRNTGRVDEQKLYARLTEMNLMEEWRGFIAFLVKYLGLPATEAIFYEKKSEKNAERIWTYIKGVGNFGKHRKRFCGKNSPRLLRKAESLFIRTSDFLNHTIVFPKNSLKFYRYYLKQSIMAL